MSAFYIFSEIVVIIADGLIQHLFYSQLFGIRYGKAWRFILVYGLYALVNIPLAFLQNGMIIRLVINSLLSYIIVFLLYESKWNSALYAIAIYVVITMLNDAFITCCVGLFGANITAAASPSVERMINDIFAQVSLLFLVLLYLTIANRKKGSISFRFLLLLFPCWFVCFVMSFFVLQSIADGQEVPWTIVLVMVGLLYMSFLVLFYAEKVKASEAEQREAILAEHHFVMQEKYYAALRAEHEETRALWHDIKKYMNAMQALAETSKAAEAQQVFEEAQGLFNNIDNTVDVGNSVVNIILNEYIGEAAESDTKVSLDVSVPPALSILAPDLYILLGNTIDNALDACFSLPHDMRQIDIQLKLHNDVLFYRISNPYDETLVKQKRGKGHGYGLKNVRRCVTKYNGDMVIDQKDGLFRLTARLNTV